MSPVFEVDDQFVVAVLTGKLEKGTASIDDVREELTMAVRNERKANDCGETERNAGARWMVGHQIRSRSIVRQPITSPLIQ